MTILATVLAISCWVLAATKLVAYLADRSRSSVLRDYTICAGALAGVFTLLVPSVVTAVDQVSANLALLLNSLLGIVCLTAGQAMLVAGSPRALRRWWTGGLLIVATRALLFTLAPPQVHTVEMIDFAKNYTQSPVLGAYDALRLIWFGIIFSNMWYTFRRYASQEPNNTTRWGFWFHARLGGLGLVYVFYEVLYLAARLIGHPLPGTERQVGTLILDGIVLMLGTGTAVLYLGPIIATHLTYQSTRPLWKAVAANHEGGVLDHGRFSGAQRLIRRRQENVDGLARLGSYYDPEIWEKAYHLALDHGETSARAYQIADAAVIAGALRAEQSGESGRPSSRSASHMFSVFSQDDLGWQIAVGKALSSPIVARALVADPPS